jgi:hypothetical protein
VAVLPAASGLEEARRRVVINVDSRESDPGRLGPDEFLARVTRTTTEGGSEPTENRARNDEERQKLWQYGIALMIVGLVAEGLLGSRIA